MRGQMMDFPLTIDHLLRRIESLFSPVEVVSRVPDKSLDRSTWGDCARRARRLASGLRSMGLEKGDRVATLMWNHRPHLEAYYGIPGAGGVLHTLNLRLAPADLAYIVNHAQDRFIIVDDVLLPLYEQIREQVAPEKVFVVAWQGQAPPEGMHGYEELLALAPADIDPVALDEQDAFAMCYTSGTTGRPKGVVYSHRSMMLHSLAECLPDTLNLSQRDNILPVVPMFHANAWGLPFAGGLAGCKMILPGPHLNPVSLLDLMADEKATFAGGVPTIWHGILQHLKAEPKRWSLSPELRMVVGGSAVPLQMIREFDRLGLRVIQAWGMTETSPLGTFCELKRSMLDLPVERQQQIRARQGFPVPFVEIRSVGDQGAASWDDSQMGELQVRGPWVASGYFDNPEACEQWTDDGWFRTGDIVTVDSEGCIKITDREKDLVKSGGEWISSVDLENTIMEHPAVDQAAVIAVPDPHWQERPMAVVVAAPGQSLTLEELHEFLRPRFAKWALPDRLEFLEQLPLTSTGKVKKSVLREQFAG